MISRTEKEKDMLTLLDRFEQEIYNDLNEDAIDELIAEDFKLHAPYPSRQGREGFREFVTSFWDAFPDMESKCIQRVLEGDKITEVYQMSGTHEGEFMDIPATGRDVRVKGISTYRITDGKIQEEWAQPDMMGMMQQLGAAPDFS